ncbi:alpha-ketoglutarate-dependent dioxygenase alkB homolog 6 [Topomyia yanbarensis]|uniref:alpha-ketoglutarate-dependent dioxygenase alkB homolog 6 n=1 Tax=Topomyia yanbarensis TaxID=2498891 RepID=UPI00273BBACB|nr:alpha-ketoglutarate-dependent dioxygenase alkB homolog 6 [Topomyia yanbarensis]
MNLQNFKINECPSSAYYIPDFITPEEESIILSMVAKAPKPRWTQLSNRRLINYGGVPHPKGMIVEEIPAWLQKHVDKVNQLTKVFEDGRKANHVLVNEYLPGQGIMPHVDGPLFYPTITTISCGSHTVLEFQEPHDRENSHPEKLLRIIKLWIEPRSLLILKDDMYHQYLHSISEITEDEIDQDFANLSVLKRGSSIVQMEDKQIRGTRISLTIRHKCLNDKYHVEKFKSQ